jgi:hypothetical protein
LIGGGCETKIQPHLSRENLTTCEVLG